MNLQELIRLVEKDIKLEKECLEDKMKTINNDYYLARLDFTVIDNMYDTKETYEKVLTILNDLQNRIIKRNQKEIEEWR